MGQPAVYANLMQLPMPTEDMWRARIEDMAAPNRNDLQLVAERGGQLVGSAGLHPAQALRRRHTAMLGISVLVEAQGQGVGQALMQAPPPPALSGLACWRLMGPSGTALVSARHCFPARSTSAAPPLP